ncbi:MAG: FHA domain-containing protein [Anaeromyxobacteraceae bacterium]
MLQCFHCGSPLDPAMQECPACGAEIEMSRLTGILGSVCRGCDAFNEPGTRNCTSCGEPLGARPPAPMVPPAPVSPAHEPPSPHDLPPIDFEAVLVEDPDFEPVQTPHPIDLLEAVGTASPSSPAAPPRTGPPPLPFESVELEPSPVTATVPLTATPSSPPRLLLERGDGREGSAWLVAGEVTFGRGDVAASFDADPWMAPVHATFLLREGRLHVRDEGSAGGTFLRLRGLSVPLRPGDSFSVGDRLLRFGGPLPAPAPPAPDGTRRLGSPRPVGPSILLEERLAGGVAGRVWLRTGPSVTLGRAGCSVNLGEDPFLSQAHAEVVLEGDGTARLRDLGSANGTFVRLPPRAERELRDGDLVRVGRQVLRVSVPGEQEG